MKILYKILGIASLILGIIGIFVPLLPTTPFLLLSAFLFSKSSVKYYNWLLNNKILGKYIRNYREEKYIPIRAKITVLTLLWGTILYSVFFVINEKWWIQLILIVVAISVTIHIASLKSKQPTNS